MKNKKMKLAALTVVIVCCLMVFIASVVPFIKISVGNDLDITVKIYYHQLFSLGEISSSSVPTSGGVISFGSVMVLVMFILAPMGLLTENKVLKAICSATSLTMFSFAIYALKEISDIKDLLPSGYDIKINSAGAVLLLVASIIAIIYAIIDVVISVFGDKIAKAMRTGSVSLKDRLDENEELFKAGYITEAERDARKAKILEGK